MKATEYIVIREIATEELRICPVEAGCRPPAGAGYTWAGPYRTKAAAVRATVKASEEQRRQLYPPAG